MSASGFHAAPAAAGLPRPCAEERLLTFEVGGAVYALPIVGVREVVEVAALACIPTLDPRLGGVMNHHGDALPVFVPGALLSLPEEGMPSAGHVLVISDPASGVPRLGLPVDRVLGLVDREAPGPRAEGSGPGRRPIEGRIANVLDPRQLVARAQKVIESSLERAD